MPRIARPIQITAEPTTWTFAEQAERLAYATMILMEITDRMNVECQDGISDDGTDGTALEHSDINTYCRNTAEQEGGNEDEVSAI